MKTTSPNEALTIALNQESKESAWKILREHGYPSVTRITVRFNAIPKDSKAGDIFSCGVCQYKILEIEELEPTGTCYNLKCENMLRGKSAEEIWEFIREHKLS